MEETEVKGMIVRICPMCDCEMKKSHYCDTCHTWIWKPQMLDVHFNSSTRGLGEPDCAYGEEHDAFHHAVQDRDRFFQERFGQQHDVQSDDVTSRKVRAAGRRQAQREQAARQREKVVQQRQLQAERYKEKRGKSSGNPKLGIIIFIIVIIYIIIGSMMSVVNMF